MFGTLAMLAACGAAPLEFRVRLAPAAFAAPASGRVVVMLLKGDVPVEPRRGPNWFNPGPMFAVDVKDAKPGDEIVVGAAAIGFPGPLAALPAGKYTYQAVFDRNQGERDFASAPGNAYSARAAGPLDPAAGGSIALTLDQTVPAPKFPTVTRVEEIVLPSKLLTEYHGRPISLRAALAFPKEYAEQPAAKFPVLYEVPGFGGTHRNVQAFTTRRTDVAGTPFLYVLLNPECPLGHHVFADSPANGPWGRALTEELLPHLEKTYRAVPGAAGRYVTGHSSGGWSSLWLQVAYPEVFNGCWSTAPDPVDFRDFQQIDLYRPGANLFTDAAGKPRPLARSGGVVRVLYKTFSDMETLFGHGGQLASFEAAFSPRNPDGTPRKMWDRRTGAVDPETIRHWEKYDLRLKLRREWPTLAPKLKGKVHVYMGGEDTFYLDGATRLLKQELAALGSDAKVEIFEGKDHGSLLSPDLRQRIAREMAARFRAAAP